MSEGVDNRLLRTQHQKLLEKNISRVRREEKKFGQLSENDLKKARHYTAITLWDMKGEMRELKRKAAYDSLTGLYNRKAFFGDEAGGGSFVLTPEGMFAKALSRADRLGNSLSLIMLDIDEFKKINDSYGHNMGDEIIKAVARIILEQLREGDLVFRYGGDEMLILLPNIEESNLEKLTERIRKKVEEQTKRATISMGVVTYTPSKKTEEEIKLERKEGMGSVFEQTVKKAEELFQHADEALYTAKNKGRNEVVVYKEPPEATK